MPSCRAVPPQSAFCGSRVSRRDKATSSLCGDVELNPGPTYTLEEKVSMILDGQKDQTRTLNDIKRDQRSLQKSVNENTENFKSLDVRMIRLESAIHKATELEAVVRDLTKTVQLLVRKVDDLENRSRRNNLIIFGLNEAENETALELTQTVQANVFQRVNVNPESIERIHRLGKKRRSPRPTIVRFYNYREKMEILRNCNRLKGTNISVSEDFSRQVQSLRKCLWDSARDERNRGAKVRLVYDKIAVDGSLFYWDLASGSRRPYGSSDILEGELSHREGPENQSCS